MVAKNLAKEKIPIIKHLAVLYMKKKIDALVTVPTV